PALQERPRFLDRLRSRTVFLLLADLLGQAGVIAGRPLGEGDAEALTAGQAASQQRRGEQTDRLRPARASLRGQSMPDGNRVIKPLFMHGMGSRFATDVPGNLVHRLTLPGRARPWSDGPGHD